MKTFWIIVGVIVFFAPGLLVLDFATQAVLRFMGYFPVVNVYDMQHVVEVAARRSDPSVCGRVISWFMASDHTFNERKHCYFEYGTHARDTRACEAFGKDTDFYNDCMVTIAVAAKELAMCEALTETGKSACYASFVRRGYVNKEICTQLNNAESRENCFVISAERTGDIKICEDSIKNPVFKTKCVFAVAERNYSTELCKTITGTDTYTRCITAATRMDDYFKKECKKKNAKSLKMCMKDERSSLIQREQKQSLERIQAEWQEQQAEYERLRTLAKSRGRWWFW